MCMTDCDILNGIFAIAKWLYFFFIILLSVVSISWISQCTSTLHLSTVLSEYGRYCSILTWEKKRYVRRNLPMWPAVRHSLLTHTSCKTLKILKRMNLEFGNIPVHLPNLFLSLWRREGPYGSRGVPVGLQEAMWFTFGIFAVLIHLIQTLEGWYASCQVCYWVFVHGKVCVCCVWTMQLHRYS